MIAESRVEPEVRGVLVDQTAPGFIGDRMAGIVRRSLEKRCHPPTTVTRRLRDGRRPNKQQHRHPNPFAALNLADGKVVGTCVPRHRHRGFLRFPELIAR